MSLVAGPLLPLLCFLLLGGCHVVFVPTIDDLRLIGLEAVDAGSRPEARWLFYGAEPRHEPALMLHLTSDEDLVVFSRKYGTLIQADASLCGDAGFDPGKELFAPSTVFDAVGDVRLREWPAASPRDASGGFRYRAFIRARYSSSRPDMFITYDLTREPADVCFTIGYGSWFRGRLQSNTIRIPAEAVRAALARPPA